MGKFSNGMGAIMYNARIKTDAMTGKKRQDPISEVPLTRTADGPAWQRTQTMVWEAGCQHVAAVRAARAMIQMKTSASSA